MKTATIVNCEFVKTWESRNGTMYTYSIELDNGDSGQINSKTENPPFLQEGQTLNYASQTDKYGTKLTRVQLKDPNTPSSGAYKAGQNWDDDYRQKMIVRQSSLSRAIEYYRDLYSHNALSGNTSTGISPQDIMSLADTFTEWVMK